MKWFKYLFFLLYRVWFYVLVTLPILVLFPLLFISILKESWYPFFFKLARIWAKVILTGMGFRCKITRKQTPQANKSYMFVANHTSMTDIMLMLAVVKNPFVFVGKKELAKIPLFGFFYKRTCILVDRSSEKSKKAVFKSAQNKLNQGLSICIFPEGGVPKDHLVLDQFKNGAFLLAINHKIPIVPLVFYDNKRLFSYTFFSGKPGIMRVKILPFLDAANYSIKSLNALKQVTRENILTELTKK